MPKKEEKTQHKKEKSYQHSVKLPGMSGGEYTPLRGGSLMLVEDGHGGLGPDSEASGTGFPT